MLDLLGSISLTGFDGLEHSHMLLDRSRQKA
jgi:hypothetical protein